MFNVKTESFLFEYFLYNAILGECTDRQKMFYCLGDLWSVEEKAVDELFLISEHENVREISTANQYMRYRRIKQYNELQRYESIYSDTENAMLAIKGNAMKVVLQYEMQTTSEMTQALMYKTLMRSAQSGNVVALRILGIIQAEGIMGKKDMKAGLENLDKAAHWGDITSILAVLKYQPKNRKKGMEMLKSSVKDTIYEYLLDVTEEKYGISANGFNKEILLLRKAFDAKKTKSDVYDAMYARLVFSPIITIKDKENILFSERKELLSEACDLPLYLASDVIPFNPSAFDEMKLQRKEERESIKTSLANNDLRSMNSYRPLCLCSDSSYIVDEYISAMTNALDGANIERYDILDLRDYDFEPTKGNAFLRCLSESKPNVLFLVFKGEISERAIHLTKSVICSSMRSKFRLAQPTVTMNLSSVLPICICDKHNAKSLQGITEMIQLAPLNACEKETAIRDMVVEKAEIYNMQVTSMEDGALKKLEDLSVENAEKLLDKIMREQRTNTKEFKLTGELIKPYIKKMGNGNNHYGFGGAINES